MSSSNGRTMRITKFRAKKYESSKDEDEEYEGKVSERIKSEKEVTRRERRSKLVDNMRATRDAASNKDANNDELNSTYLVPDDPRFSHRRQLLELWRRERKEKMISTKIGQRPVFKVSHLNTKDYELQNVSILGANMSSLRFQSFRSMSDLSKFKNDSSTRTLPTSNSTSRIRDGCFQFGHGNCDATSKFTFMASVSASAEAKPTKPSSSRFKKPAEPVAKKAAIPKPEPKFLKPAPPPPPPLPPSNKPTRTRNFKVNEITERDVENLRNCLSSTRIEPPNLKELGLTDLDLFEPIVEEKLDAKTEPIVQLKETKENQEATETKIVPLKETEESRDVDNLKEEESEYAKAARFYRNLVVETTNSLNAESAKWMSICEEAKKSEQVEGEIRCACGLAKLLIDERFNQFSELIEQCEESNSRQAAPDSDVKLVKPTDLEGFWEMIYQQVLNVQKLFGKLEKLRANNFVEVVAESPPPPPVKKEVTRVKKAPVRVVKKQVENGSDKPSEAEAAGEKVEKKKTRSRFAEFKEKLKNNVNKDEVVGVEVVLEAPKPIEPPAKFDENLLYLIEPYLEPKVEKDEVKEEKKEEKCEEKAPVVAVVEDVVNKGKESAWSKVKSRVSDLIKFDSPIGRRVSKRLSNKANLANENNQFVRRVEVIEENEPSFSQEEMDDMFGDLEAKVHWRTKKKQSSDQNTPLKTPRTITQQANFPSSSSTFKNITNSPLLKLAFISSHGKRQSLTGGKQSLNF